MGDTGSTSAICGSSLRGVRDMLFMRLSAFWKASKEKNV